MSDVAFTVGVDKSDWKDDLRAWVCSAIAIPGVEIEEVFVDGHKQDEDWFKTDDGLNAIRWIPPKEEPPESVTFKLKLTKDLSTQELTTRWKKFAIVLPLIGTVVGVLAGIYPWSEPEQQPEALSGWGVWSVRGHVIDEGFKTHDVTAQLRPPDLRLNDDFTFTVPIPINSKSTEPAQLILSLKRDPGQESPPVHVIHLLTKEGSKLPVGAHDYNLEINQEEKIIRIPSISFSQDAADTGYDPPESPMRADPNSGDTL